MMDVLPNLLIAWGIQLSSLLSPGPAVTLILGVAASRGRKDAVVTAMGIGSAAIALALATAMGLAALLTLYGDLFLLIKVIGVSYLCWLAFKSFKAAITLPPLPAANTVSQSGVRTAVAGFFMQLANPKALFFWMAIAAASDMASLPIWAIALLIAGAFLNSVLVHVAWALLLSAGGVRALYLRARRWVEAGIGIFFAGFALRLAMQER